MAFSVVFSYLRGEMKDSWEQKQVLLSQIAENELEFLSFEAFFSFFAIYSGWASSLQSNGSRLSQEQCTTALSCWDAHPKVWLRLFWFSTTSMPIQLWRFCRLRVWREGLCCVWGPRMASLQPQKWRTYSFSGCGAHSSLQHCKI